MSNSDGYGKDVLHPEEGYDYYHPKRVEVSMLKPLFHGRAPVYEKYMECTAVCSIHDYVDLRSFRIIIGS